MSVIEQAIRWNDEAAALTSAGSLIAATQLLHQATDVLWTLVFGLNHGRQLHLVLPPSIMDTQVNINVQDDQLEYNQQGDMFIHDCLLLLSVDLTETSQTHLDHVLLVVALYSTFNLALVYHLRGRIVNTDCMLAKRAMALYRSVLVVAQSSPCEDLLQC